MSSKNRRAIEKIKWQPHEISKVTEQKGEVEQKTSRRKEGIEEKTYSKKGECMILIVRQPLFVNERAL
jgi:hypothetical protein